MAHSALFFGTFALDLANTCLVRDGDRIALSPKDCRLLHFLVTHAGEVVPHATLLEAVWPGIAVTPDVLKARVRRLRRLLGDDARAPRFIANVHGEGYRFVADPVKAAAEVEVDAGQPLVGRARELLCLDRALDRAASARRGTIFVTGEPGMGKTALIDTFVARAGNAEAVDGPVWIGRGQAIEQYGQGEAFLPIMQALSDLARNADADLVKQALLRYAPSWLAHLPALLPAAERAALISEAGRTPERVGRQLAEVLEALTTVPHLAGRPTVLLVIEDLHWADPSTINVLSLLTRRREHARLLIVGSYRPLELSAHPLRAVVQELRAREAAVDIPLAGLTTADVEALLEIRFPGHTFPPSLAATLAERTAGNPLFIRALLDAVLSAGHIAEEDTWRFQGEVEAAVATIPRSIHELLSRQHDRLDAETRIVLEAAGISGRVFSVATVAAALDQSPAWVEEACQRLAARELFVRVAEPEESPDGNVTSRFEFLHDVYREWWAGHVGPERRALWHRAMGLCKEAAWRERAHEIAAELAIQFEAGREPVRAVRYRTLAAQSALQRAAQVEAETHLNEGMRLLATIADGPDRWRQELDLQVVTGTLAAIADAYASPAAEHAFRRAQQLSQQLGDSAPLFGSLFGLFRLFWSNANHAAALDVTQSLLRIAIDAGDPVREMMTHVAIAQALAMQGEAASSLAHARTAQDLYARHWHPSLLGVFGHDPRVICAGNVASALHMLGFPDQALRASDEALAFDVDTTHPFMAASAYWGAASLHHMRGDARQVDLLARKASSVNGPTGNRDLFGASEIYVGWASVVGGSTSDGIERIEHALATMRRAGSAFFETAALALLADGFLHLNRWQEAARVVEQGLAATTRYGPGWIDAELHRLHGCVILRSANADSGHEDVDVRSIADAETAFHQALTVARKQGMRCWELRAAVSLGELWASVGRARDACDVVVGVHAQFTEGHDTLDVRRATEFLARHDRRARS